MTIEEFLKKYNVDDAMRSDLEALTEAARNDVLNSQMLDGL